VIFCTAGKLCRVHTTGSEFEELRLCPRKWNSIRSVPDLVGSAAAASVANSLHKFSANFVKKLRALRETLFNI
jgi:hypothetical protein